MILIECENLLKMQYLTINGSSPSSAVRSKNIVGSTISSKSSCCFVLLNSSSASIGSSLICPDGIGYKFQVQMKKQNKIKINYACYDFKKKNKNT